MTWKNMQITEREAEQILRLARESLDVPGDFVEMGCYKGDTSLLLAELLVENQVEKSAKKLWIYDSFEGLPKKSISDESVIGESFEQGVLAVTKREVKERFLHANLPVPVIKKAWFCDLAAEDMPERIAFAFLDGDFYESIKDSLKIVGPRMSASGILVVHDYNNLALPGVKKAFDEWEKSTGEVGFRVVLL